MLNDKIPDTTNTTKRTCTTADTADVTADTSDDEAFMQTLDHSQPWPRKPAHTLPQDLVECINDPHTSGALEILLQQVLMQYLQTFYDLANKGVNPLLIQDTIMPFWESSLSDPSAVPTPNHEMTQPTCPHCGWAPNDTPTCLATTWKSHLHTHKDEPTFNVTNLPAPFLAAVGLYVCQTCNDPTSMMYISQTNLDSHNKRKHSPTCTQSNSDILAKLFPNSDWSQALQWLDQANITILLQLLSSPTWHQPYPSLPHNTSPLQSNPPPSHRMNISLPTAILNQLPIPFGNFYFFFKPTFSDHTENAKHTPICNASHTVSNSYTKVKYKLSTTMPMINAAQPSAQPKSTMKSNKS